MASVGIIGSGMAGLVTAKTLLDDGFNVQILTREHSPGGVWSEERVYPGLKLNNVSGEYRFSYLTTSTPANSEKTDGKLTGEVMQGYMESFEQRFLPGVIRYAVTVLDISREPSGKWTVKVKDMKMDKEESLHYDKLVLCTGGCSRPNFPPELTPESASRNGFAGLLIHTCKFKENAERLLREVQPGSEKPVIVVGCGKSAQDATTYLVNEGRRVTMIFDKANGIYTTKTPLPEYFRKSRFLSVMSPHYHLRTRLERFLHTTWLGSLIVHAWWKNVEKDSFAAVDLPADSPFRNARDNFWDIRTNGEGAGSPTGFFSLVKEKKFDVVSPARVVSFSADGKGILLADGRCIEAAAVVLATGYASSWEPLFNKEMRDELGINFSLPTPKKEDEHMWDNYVTLKNPPVVRDESPVAASPIYRGLVPARNILKRDFAVNGASFTTNMGYIGEVQAHWISSYFLGDAFLKLPTSPEEALAAAHLKSVWLRKRHPVTPAWVNESFSSEIAFWNCNQACDDLLEDMGLPIMRSGGNWFNWPFKVVDLKEIATLHEERAAKRVGASV